MQIFRPCSRESDAVGLVKPSKSNFKPHSKRLGTHRRPIEVSQEPLGFSLPHPILLQQL